MNSELEKSFTHLAIQIDRHLKENTMDQVKQIAVEGDRIFALTKDGNLYMGFITGAGSGEWFNFPQPPGCAPDSPRLPLPTC
jgi:hypothetical protein